MTFPIAIQPNYGTGPNAGNAAIIWLQNANKSGGAYIQQDGTVILGNTPGTGQWVPVPPAEIPAEWKAAYPNLPAPEKWVPLNPSDPREAIYQYATVYGQDGYDLWVLGTEAAAALAQARATIVPIPEVVTNPPPVPVPVRPPPAGFWEYLAELRARFESHF